MRDDELAVCAVLSGNRNFEGRIHPLVRASYLASPPLVVAYALAGLDRRSTSSTSRWAPTATAADVYLRDLWPSSGEVRAAIEASVTPELFEREYATIWDGDERWRALPAPEGALFDWDPDSTYVREPSFFQDLAARARRRCTDIEGARCLVVLGDSVTTDHISPAGAIPRDMPAGRYLLEHGVEPRDFNSFGARRGNHEVMVRGTFGNIRLRNALADGREGGYTAHLPSGEPLTIFDAAERYRAEGVPLVALVGQGVRLRLVARLGRQGHAAARHPRGDRRELRAHPPLQPGRHGRAAAGVRRRPVGRVARPRRPRALHDPRHRRRRRAARSG